MRGRKPKPTQRLKSEGTFDASRHGGRIVGEPKPTTALHQPPVDLAADELAEWQHIMDNAPPGLLKQLDRAVLLNYVRAVVAQGNAWTEMQRGLTVMSAGGVEIEAPAVRTFQKMSLLMLRCAEQLGFSPASRPRVHVDAEAEKTNPFEAFGAARRDKAPAAEKPERKVH